MQGLDRDKQAWGCCGVRHAAGSLTTQAKPFESIDMASHLKVEEGMACMGQNMAHSPCIQHLHHYMLAVDA